MTIAAPAVTRTVASPIGDLLLAGDGRCLTGLFLSDQRRRPDVDADREDPDAFGDAAAQLAEWFDGRRRRFELALAPRGSSFQRQVWDALLEIPFGQTESYGEVAARVGRPGAARAVGQAVGRNPIGIVIPCHRVLGAGGRLGGYAGGVARKAVLLEHEARVRAPSVA